MGLDLVQARRQAKELLRAARSGDARALSRLRADRPPRLADAQAAVARSLGFSSWPALVRGLLQAAVEDGDVERLRGLIAGGASMRGSDLLLYARDPEITRLLIEGGARLDARDSEQLPRWASAGDDQVVSRLLDAGVPVDSRGLRNGTALHYAALWGCPSTLRHLLARGADPAACAEPPDRPGVQEWTALDWAGWGSRHTPAASDRRDAYRECAAILLDAGARLTDRTEIAELINGVRDSAVEYLPGRPVRVRVRVRGTRVDIDDMGGAIAVCGTPDGWRQAAEGAVAELGWNVRRNGVVFMQAPHGRSLTWIIDRTAEASAAVCEAVLQLGDTGA